MWWECLRWATLPPSGHYPLDDPPTCLDAWPLSIPNHGLCEGPDVCHFYEQLALYPTKRRLPVVCKQWAALSTEFLYECIALDYEVDACGRLTQLLTTLQDSERGAALAKFVKRIDIESGTEALSKLRGLFNTFLSILPELRVLRPWKYHIIQALDITIKDQPAISKLTAPIIASSTIASVNTTLHNQICWKALTVVIDTELWDDIPEGLPTINRPMVHLKYLTLVFSSLVQSTIGSSLSSLQNWCLPSLTHLCIHSYGNEDRGAAKGALDVFGKQLELFAFTSDTESRAGTKSWFCEMLTAAPNIKRLVFRPQPSDNISLDQLPPMKYASVSVVGLPMNIDYADGQHVKDFSWYIRLCMQAFPSLRIFRITGILSLPNRAEKSKWYNNYWVYGAAIDLRAKGVRFEDQSGRDLWEELGMTVNEVEAGDEGAGSKSK